MALKKQLRENIRATSILPSDNSTSILESTITEGFTQSEIGVWDDCAEKWYLGYNHRLEVKGTFNWHFVYGDAVHETLMHWYRHGEEKIAPLQFPEGVILTTEQEFERDKWNIILQVTMRRYFKYWERDLDVFSPWAVEEEVEVMFEGIKLRGKIDLGFDLDGTDHVCEMDHKTFNLDDYLGWNFRFQFMFYIWLAQKAKKKRITHFYVNGIRKPLLRVKQGESIESFGVRVEQDMIQMPEKYFPRHPLPMIKHSMEHFEERVLRPKLERIHLLTEAKPSATIIESLVRNQNTNNCVTFGEACQFLPICKSALKREGGMYIQRESKHPELG